MGSWVPQPSFHRTCLTGISIFPPRHKLGRWEGRSEYPTNFEAMGYGSHEFPSWLRWNQSFSSDSLAPFRPKKKKKKKKIRPAFHATARSIPSYTLKSPQGPATSIIRKPVSSLSQVWKLMSPKHTTMRSELLSPISLAGSLTLLSSSEILIKTSPPILDVHK